MPVMSEVTSSSSSSRIALRVVFSCGDHMSTVPVEPTRANRLPWPMPGLGCPSNVMDESKEPEVTGHAPDAFRRPRLWSATPAHPAAGPLLVRGPSTPEVRSL